MTKCVKTHLCIAICLLFSMTALAQQSGTIFAVRHAEKQSDATDTPLSDKGLARAECLAQTLKDAHITTVFVTQYQRTRQTAEPTIQESQAKVETISAKSTAEIAKAASDAAKSGNVLIVGHSNTVPDILSTLGGPQVSIPDDSYNQLFLFDPAHPRQITVLHYCPNLPADNTSHPANSMAQP